MAGLMNALGDDYCPLGCHSVDKENLAHCAVCQQLGCPDCLDTHNCLEEEIVLKPSEALKAALDLLGPDGERWTRCVYARNSEGDSVTHLEQASCFCGVGALRVAVFNSLLANECVSDPMYKHAKTCLDYVALQRSGLRTWPLFQDIEGRTFSEIRDAFHEAIQLAEIDEAKQAAY